MLTWLVRQFHYGSALMRTHDSPRQLAAGLAAGLVVGLVPKGNLLSAILLTILFSLRLNLAVAMICAAVVSFLGSWVDPISDGVGHYLLAHDGLQATWVRLANTPLVPWTRFDNTIVLGSLVVGLVCCWPVYRLSLPAFERWKKYQLERAAEKAEQGFAGPSDAALSDDLRRLRRRRFDAFLAEIERLSPGRRAA